MADLLFDSVSKGFPGVQALENVSFGVEAGSVHALCGENGAGKSTLLKILSGVYRPDTGSLRIQGQNRVFNDAAEAIHSGVAVIYQELHLVSSLSIAENLFLGHLPLKGGLVDWKKLRTDSAEILTKLGVDVNPDTLVGELPIAIRQMVEIGKALSRDANIFAFDEPTSSLSSKEVDSLFSVINQLKSEGKVILYVSHRMDEIQRVCDAATVLRDGRHIETFETMEGRSTDMIVERMVGRKIDDIFHYRPREATGDALRISGLQGPGMRFSADLSVKKGEIVGLFGLVGAGRSETLKAIFSGAKGSVEVCGKTVVIKSPKDAIRSGIVFCPEDRKKEGIVGLQSVKENINMAGRKSFWINERSETESTEDLVQRLGIKTPAINQLVKNLSGGNQQKTVLARWLNQDISVILLDEPTRGIDVGAKSEIYDIIYGLAEQGVGVLLVSSELPEVMGVCDRILVMNEGRIVDDVPRSEATEEKLLRLALPGAA